MLGRDSRVTGTLHEDPRQIALGSRINLGTFDSSLNLVWLDEASLRVLKWNMDLKINSFLFSKLSFLCELNSDWTYQDSKHPRFEWMEIWIEIERDAILLPRERRIKGEKENHSARQIYAHLLPGDHNLRQQDQTPGETRRNLESRKPHDKRAKRPTPTTRLVSCFSSLFENETRYVILFITAKCKRWPQRAERNINAYRAGRDLSGQLSISRCNEKMQRRLEKSRYTDESRSV